MSRPNSAGVGDQIPPGGSTMVDYAAPEMTQTDVGRWLEQRQSALHVTTTTITPAGQTLDWVPVESQASEPIAEPPPAVTHDVQADQARPTTSVRFDAGEPGPAGHVPVLRPALSRIGNLDQLRRVQSKSGGLRVNVNRANKKITDPNPAGYFHSLSSQSATVYGADAWLNLWDPAVDIPSSPGDDHSISQLWLQNYQKPQLQSLEGGLTVDHNLNGDSANHLFTYYTTNGYSQDGNNLGGYNRLESGWIQYDPSIYPGIKINGTSVQGQSPQLEIGIKYQLWQGNWWFGFNNNESGPWIWLGYYPGSLFNGGIANPVDGVGWGGEVYSALANPCATADQMGSGRHAADGWTYACYQRLMHNQTDLNGSLANFAGVASVDVAASNCPANEYTIATFMNSGSSWGSYQYFGGPAA
jgi:hypothetical protein